MDEEHHMDITDDDHLTIEFPPGLDTSLGTLDVSNLIVGDPTETGSFDVKEVESTSFGRLLQFLPTPALVVDASLTILFSNGACRRIAPHLDSLVGQSLVSFMPGKRRAGIVRSLMEKVLADGKSRVGEVILGPGKGKIWARLRLRALRLGRERSLLVIVEDLTLEKRQLNLIKKYSQQLQSARDELEERVNQRTAALRKANEDLKAEMNERLRAQEALRESERRYRAVVEDQTELITRFLPDGTITFANEACCRYFDTVCEHMIGTNFFHRYHEEDCGIAQAQCASLSPGNPVWSFEIRALVATSEWRWHNQTIRAIFAETGAIEEYQCVARDVTDRHTAQEAVAKAKEQWERTFDAVPDLVAIIDSDRRLARVNRAMSLALGIPQHELIGSLCHVVFHGLDRPLCECPHSDAAQGGERFFPETIETSIKGRTYAVSVSPLRDEQGRFDGCVHVARDITRRKRLEDELKFRASRDSLTGLFNRSHFLETLGIACASAKRYAQLLSVSIIDVDKFKDINDKHGHPTGDLVLERFGRIVQKELRSSDFAGRFGGDEFIIAFPQSGTEGAVQSVERIRVALAKYVFAEDGNPFNVHVTGGVAQFSPTDMTMQDLIQRADMALYEAKALGRNRVLVYRHPSATDPMNQRSDSIA